MGQQWRSIHGGAAEQRGLCEVAEANSARPSQKDGDNVPGVENVVSGPRQPQQAFTHSHTLQAGGLEVETQET